jgi:hypothetical protein
MRTQITPCDTARVKYNETSQKKVYGGGQGANASRSSCGEDTVPLNPADRLDKAIGQEHRASEEIPGCPVEPRARRLL